VIQQQPMTVEHVSNGWPIWVFLLGVAATAVLSVAAAPGTVRPRQARRTIGTA
jgi:hypothetical protein